MYKKYEKFLCAKDMVYFLNVCAVMQSKITNDLKNMHIGFSNPCKVELKSRRKELRAQLKQLKATYVNTKRLIESYVTFSEDDLIPFLVEYLSIKENRRYINMAKVEIRDELTAAGTGSYQFTPFNSYYHIITTEENKAQLQKNNTSSWITSGVADDINEYLAVCSDRKYICLNASIWKKMSYCLLNGTCMSNEFANFSYLKSLIEKIIDLKIQEPSLTDKQVLAKIIIDERNKVEQENKKM